MGDDKTCKIEGINKFLLHNVNYVQKLKRNSLC